ncbi:MAG: zinc ribbon domain-containing protein [Lachnospiraceae bacterium]|nr:zinc ribbon domain-containing protein [Lachnospiraceae bacterium]
MYPYSSYSSSSLLLSSGGSWQIIVGTLLALAATIVLYVLVFPKSKEGNLPPFLNLVRDFFDVKYLLIEKIAKFIYVFMTLASILVGFFLLFGRTFVAGLVLMILGPILHRLFYELFMLAILLVKNVMEINNHLKGAGNAESIFDSKLPVLVKPAAPEASEETKGADKFCPHCGAALSEDDVYCRGCGTKVK